MKTYSTGTISQAIELLGSRGYEIINIEEGTLGHGHVICIAPDKNHYNVEIKEVYLNEWSSGHTVRNFAKPSKRIAELLEKVGYAV